jgi:acetyl-CoA carboxylase biotin carboxyl carrier protein
MRESKVPDDASKTPGPFDLRTVKALVALMSQHDLNEIDLQEGEHRIRIRRGLRAIAPASAPMPTATVSTSSASPTNQQPKTDTAPAADAKKLIEIKSPTPGTFYAAPSPDAPPYVKTGSKVTPTSVVCQIEAMKIFNEITADCTGTIVEVLVENQQAVEYGQVLFRVDPG